MMSTEHLLFSLPSLVLVRCERTENCLAYFLKQVFLFLFFRAVLPDVLTFSHLLIAFLTFLLFSSSRYVYTSAFINYQKKKKKKSTDFLLSDLATLSFPSLVTQLSLPPRFPPLFVIKKVGACVGRRKKDTNRSVCLLPALFIFSVYFSVFEGRGVEGRGRTTSGFNSSCLF